MDKTFWMAIQPIASQAARDVLRTVGTALAAHGYITNGAGTEAFIGAGMTLAGLFWGWFTTSGYLQLAGLLKKLTATKTQAAAVTAAQVLPPAAAVDTSTKAATVASVAKVLLIAFALGLLAFPHGANAASKVTKAAVQTAANPLGVIQSFTEADLTAALADATTNNDIAAVNCYTALLPIVKSGVANPLPTGLGGFQLLQKARDLQTMLANLQSPNGPLAQLNLACAPLVLDVQNTMVLLGVVGGGVALTGGAGGLALPGLGALIPGL